MVLLAVGQSINNLTESGQRLVNTLGFVEGLAFRTSLGNTLGTR